MRRQLWVRRMMCLLRGSGGGLGSRLEIRRRSDSESRGSDSGRRDQRRMDGEMVVVVKKSV